MTFTPAPTDKEVHDMFRIPAMCKHFGAENRAALSHTIYQLFHGRISNEKLLSFLDHFYPQQQKSEEPKDAE